MDRSKVLNWSYSWAMHDFRKFILWAFVAAIFFAAAIASRTQTQPNSIATNAGAPSSTEQALPEIATLVRQAIQQQRFSESREQDYVFREDTNDIRLDKDCTWAPKCPAPFGVRGVKGVAFHVVHYSEHHFEVFWLDGVRVARVLPSCDHCGTVGGSVDTFIRNIPVSTSEFDAENQRVDSEVAEAKALRAQGKDASSPDDPPQILLSRMLELCTFSNPRRQAVEGRSTILLDFGCNPSASPQNVKETLVKFFSGTVGIDEEDHAVQHVEGRFLADVNLDGGDIKIRKNTRATIINRRVDAGIWLLARVDARGEGSYYSFSIDGDGHIFAGSYRKFRSTGRILPGFTEVSADSLPTPARQLPPSPVAPQVRPAFPQGLLPAPQEQDAASREKAEADKARWEALAREEQRLAQETQARGYWVDRSTGLMWAAKDNGKDVIWRQARKYCSNLRLAGYSDWRLASLDELASLVQKSAPTLDRVGNIEILSMNMGGSVRGGLSLTGNPWSSNRELDRFGHPYGPGWFFDFRTSKPSYDLPYFRNTKYALCVRRSGD